ncbi:MAG: hypothetical protein U0441_14795 [Polyangiaceae bacterium]
MLAVLVSGDVEAGKLAVQLVSEGVAAIGVEAFVGGALRCGFLSSCEGCGFAVRGAAIQGVSALFHKGATAVGASAVRHERICRERICRERRRGRCALGCAPRREKDARRMDVGFQGPPAVTGGPRFEVVEEDPRHVGPQGIAVHARGATRPAGYGLPRGLSRVIASDLAPNVFESPTIARKGQSVEVCAAALWADVFHEKHPRSGLGSRLNREIPRERIDLRAIGDCESDAHEIERGRIVPFEDRHNLSESLYRRAPLDRIGLFVGETYPRIPKGTGRRRDTIK